MAWASTETIGSGLDRATIVAWEDAHDGETPGGGACIGQVTGAPDTGTVYFMGFAANMDATNKMILEAASGNATDGTDGSGDDAIFDQELQILEGTYDVYLDVKNMEFAAKRAAVRNDSGGVVQFSNCFFRNVTLPGNYSGYLTIDNIGAALTVNIGGCLFKGGADAGNYRAGVYINDSDVTVNMTNNTVYVGVYSGVVELGGTCNCQNTVAANTTNSDFNSISGTFANCASEDATSPDAGTDSITPDDEWITPATDNTGDFKVEAGSSVLMAGGTTLPSWYTDLCDNKDMRGYTWHATTPEIGCYSYADNAAGGLSIPIAIHHYKQMAGS